MGDPRNPARVNEQWDPHRLEVMDLEIRTFLCDLGTLSGGWAWHYMSPPGHIELKLHHDHKDIDMFIDPSKATDVFYKLKAAEYNRIWTKYDDSSKSFLRYEQHIDGVKIILDLFVEEVTRWYLIRHSVWVVEPKTLLSFYTKKIHTTDDCTAVIAARELVTKGITPIGREELCQTTL